MRRLRALLLVMSLSLVATGCLNRAQRLGVVDAIATVGEIAVAGYIIAEHDAHYHHHHCGHRHRHFEGRYNYWYGGHWEYYEEGVWYGY